MKNFSNPAKSIIILIFVLLIIIFYESQRIDTFSLAVENPFLRSLMLSLTSASERIKSSLGLAPFFTKDQSFWQEIKKSPKIFVYSVSANQLAIPDSKIATTTEPAIKPLAKIESPYSILIAGDSFVAEGLGPDLEKELILYNETKVYRKGIYSTGLSRPDYFDWQEEMKKLIVEQNPNVAVLIFGANDGQDQRPLDKKIIHYRTEEWNIEYAKRVDEVLEILTENKILVFWVGNPIAKSKLYSDKMEHLNLIYKNECQKYENCVYISTWNLLLDSNGKYTDYLPDETGKIHLIRRSDGIHTRGLGSEILVKEVIRKMKEKMELQPQAND